MSQYDEIERIHKLFKDGILTEQEYQAKKKELLSESYRAETETDSKSLTTEVSELDARWATTIAGKLSQGYTIIERDDKFHIAILESNQSKNVNHILHAVLTLFTCIWGIVWLIEIAGEKKVHRIRLTVDRDGRILEERISVA